MDCILLRHGIAVERDEWEGTDADRPLMAIIGGVFPDGSVSQCASIA